MYRESQKNMKTIGIADFKKLVMERLANPRDYAGRSLVLWNADYNKYGIARRVIEQCCEKYNKENPNDQVWFKLSDAPTFDTDDYTKQTCMCRKYVRNEKTNEYNLHTEIKRCGIIFNTGSYYTLYEQEDWLKFVNAHTNSNGGIHQDCTMIVCAQADQLSYIPYGDSKDSKRILKEEQFGNNCDIYSIQPTLDEWAAWIAPYCQPEISQVVCAFIKKNGIGDVPYGFEYWQRIIQNLRNLVENQGCPLNQIPKSYVETMVKGVVSTKSPVPEFCDFIYEQDMSM